MNGPGKLGLKITGVAVNALLLSILAMGTKLGSGKIVLVISVSLASDYADQVKLQIKI
jgi:hypothetical protein